MNDKPVGLISPTPLTSWISDFRTHRFMSRNYFSSYFNYWSHVWLIFWRLVSTLCILIINLGLISFSVSSVASCRKCFAGIKSFFTIILGFVCCIVRKTSPDIKEIPQCIFYCFVKPCSFIPDIRDPSLNVSSLYGDRVGRQHASRHQQNEENYRNRCANVHFCLLSILYTCMLQHSYSIH